MRFADSVKKTFSYWMAGMLVSTILVGASIAYAADLPSQDPTQSTGVFPTFTGVDVQGPIRNSDDDGDLMGKVFIDDQVVVGDTLEVDGGMLSLFQNNLMIGEALTVAKLITICELVSFINFTVAGMSNTSIWRE